MYVNKNDRFYYLTLMNEKLHTSYKTKKSYNRKYYERCISVTLKWKTPQIRILGSGLTLNFAINAQEILQNYGIKAEVWSITSFNELYRDGIEQERLDIVRKLLELLCRKMFFNKITNYCCFRVPESIRQSNKTMGARRLYCARNRWFWKE